MKKYFIAILISVLFLITFFALPNVDYAEPNVLFYFEHLPVLYHISVLASIVAAVYFGRSSLGVFYVVVFSLLLFWIPSIMLVHPWIWDSYPFVAEAVYITRNGYLGPFHVNLLQETPALGLTFGPYLLITNISPFLLLKIYPGFVATIFTVLLYSMARKIDLDRRISIIAPLLFTSIFWPNLLHFSRQGFSLVYYFSAWFLLIRLVSEKQDQRIFGLLILQVVLLTLSHPASSFFFLMNLVAVAVVGRIFGKIRHESLRLITRTSLISALTWLVWNIQCLPSSKAVRVWRDIGERFSQSVIEDPTEVSGAARIFSGHTPLYSIIINIRLALTLLISAGIVFLPIVVYRYTRNRYDRKLLLILVGWGLSNLFSAIPLMYAGLPFFARPAAFTLSSWGPLGALIYKTLHQKRKTKMKALFITVFILSPSFLMPIVKYAPLPFVFPTSRELTNISFLHLHWSNDVEVVYFYEPFFANMYSWLLYGREPSIRSIVVYGIHTPNEGLDPDVVSRSALWITYQPVTRDAFWNYTPSFLSVVENATQSLPETTHSKVYDSGWPEMILIPTFNSNTPQKIANN